MHCIKFEILLSFSRCNSPKVPLAGEL